jgi:anthranilate synthase component 2
LPNYINLCSEVITTFAETTPILGIDFGHRLIAELFGASICPAINSVYGLAAPIHIANGSPIFRDLPPVIEAGRYHSLVVKRNSLPEELLVSAESEEEEVMGIKHRDYNIYGLQFRPESYLTKSGTEIIGNFLSIEGKNND